MAGDDWPDLDELKLVLDVDQTSSSFDDHLESLLEAGIAHVKALVHWVDDVSTVTPKLHHAALRAAVVMRPNAPQPGPGSPAHADVDSDPVFQSLMKGKRREFGTA